MTGCEWNPAQDRNLYVHEKAHAFAAVSLGHGAWYLCAGCAALPEFKRYRSRVSLKQSNAAPTKGSP